MLNWFSRKIEASFSPAFLKLSFSAQKFILIWLHARGEWRLGWNLKHQTLGT